MKHIITLLIAVAALFALAGCASQEAVKTAIVTYLDENGQDMASEFIDKLVADGRLGSANAADIKAALPQGVEKVKEVINKIGESEK